VTAFWKGERCEYCDGPIVEQTVDLFRKNKGRYVLIERAPAGACTECGTRHYAADVLKSIEETIGARRKAKREVVVAVDSL